MPRKSAALRSSQAQELLANYTEAGIADSYQGRFIADMVRRFDRNKGLSKKQREWLDGLIEDGVPAPKGDPSTIAKLDAAMAAWASNDDRVWESGVLNDFKSRLNRGYDLSEKQSGLMEKLLQRAADDTSGVNIFNPSEEQVADLHALVKIYGGYAPQWRGERPAVAKAVRRVSAFLCGEGTIEGYHYDKLYKSMGAKLRKFKNPRFAIGNIGWVTTFNGGSLKRDYLNDTPERSICTAISDAYINDRGIIVNDWMLPTGAVHTISQDNIGKRK